MQVVQGTCGWQDQEYPPSVKKDATSKLQYYSRHWPCVEVNSSTYQIAAPKTTTAWAKAVPPGFLFHFKAFGLFCSRGSPLSNLPWEIREMLPPGRWASNSYVPLNDLPAEALDRAWSLFHASLEPVYRAGKLGIITFQFHLSFQPTESNLAYVLECRRRLDCRFRMAAEFRCRRWFTEDAWRPLTITALSSQGIAWVAADELEHETYQRDREQSGLPAGQARKVLPIALEVTTPEFFYVRVHRRHGGEERKLEREEIMAWVERIEGISDAYASILKGPIYLLWGTEHKDVPLRNANALREGIPRNLRFEWKPKAPPGTIGAFFSGPGQSLGSAKGDESGGGDEDDGLLEGGEKDDMVPIHSTDVQINKDTSRKTSTAQATSNRGIKRYFSQT